MNRLSEKYFSDFKGIINTRLNIKGMRRFIFGTFLVTCFMVGIPLLNIVNSEEWITVGWSDISHFWQIFFCFELVLSFFQILIFFIFRKENNLSQKILSVSIIIYGYKLTIDPFVFISYAAMDRGVYENVKLYLIAILILGLLLHLIFLSRWISKLKKGDFSLNGHKGTKKSSNSLKILFIIFAIVVCSILLIRKIPEFENVILIIGSIIILVGIAYAICEFIIVAYCIFRFPSFVVNPPSQKKSQYVNPKNQRKKKKRKC